MKNTILSIIVSSVTISLLIGCGSDGGNSNDSESIITEFTLQIGESLVCTSVTTFTIVPSAEEPDVIITQDAENGDTTIAIDINSSGSASVLGCTKK